MAEHTHERSSTQPQFSSPTRTFLSQERRRFIFLPSQSGFFVTGWIYLRDSREDAINEETPMCFGRLIIFFLHNQNNVKRDIGSFAATLM